MLFTGSNVAAKSVVRSQCSQQSGCLDSHGKHRLEGGFNFIATRRASFASAVRDLHPAIPREARHVCVQPVRGGSVLQSTRCSAPNRRGNTTCAVAMCSWVRGRRQSSLPAQ